MIRAAFHKHCDDWLKPVAVVERSRSRRRRRRRSRRRRRRRSSSSKEEERGCMAALQRVTTPS